VTRRLTADIWNYRRANSKHETRNPTPPWRERQQARMTKSPNDQNGLSGVRQRFGHLNFVL